jgi:hypothetical protein
MKQCVVSFVDFGGIRHSVEVQADSMYEAAAVALENFHAHDCSPGRGSELEVQGAERRHSHDYHEEIGGLGESGWRIAEGRNSEAKD